MLPPAFFRQRLARTLRAAYAEGVLSQSTLLHRLELLFASPLIDPARIVGDLPRRRAHHFWEGALGSVKRTWRALRASVSESQTDAVLLALDWEGGHNELLIGRHPSCDIVLPGAAVSRRHARVRFRDGAWILQDLNSTNGTFLNGRRVGRCRLRPGDHLVIANEHLLVD